MRHTYASSHERRVDFWAGFVAWIVFNGLAVLGVSRIGSHPTITLVLSSVLILINVAAPIVAAFTRKYVAFGILLAFATALALTVFEGVFFTISDFAGGLNNTSVAIGFLVVGFLLYAIGAFFVLRKIDQGIR